MDILCVIFMKQLNHSVDIIPCINNVKCNNLIYASVFLFQPIRTEQLSRFPESVPPSKMASRRGSMSGQFSTGK